AMPTVALVAIAVVVGLAYWRTRPLPTKPDTTAKVNNVAPPTSGKEPQVTNPEIERPTPLDQAPASAPIVASNSKRPRINSSRSTDQSDVLPDVAFTATEDRDTATPPGRARNIRRPFRSIKSS